MARTTNYTKVTNDREVKSYVYYNSKNLYKKIEFKNNLILYRKYLTHSDIVTVGKSNKKNQLDLDKYILYYDSIDELKNVIKLSIGQQSSINLPKQFYPEVGIYDKDLTKPYRGEITREFNCFIPNDIKKNFNVNDFKIVVKRLGKKIYDEKVLNQIEDNYFNKANEEDFYKISKLTVTKHGIGTSDDLGFHNLRKILFKGDVVNFLIIQESKELYILPERNEKYFLVLSNYKTKYVDMPLFSEYKKAYKQKFVNYLNQLEELELLENSNSCSEVLENELQYMCNLRSKIKNYEANNNFPQYRWYQDKWKEVLIKSLALQLKDNSILRCAISGVTAKNKKLSYLFIASHIKDYSICVSEGNWEEAFDPNNGILLISNVDKLFDQHDITINRFTGKIKHGDIVKDIISYKKILPNNVIGLFYFNENRKQFLRYHNDKFIEKHGIEIFNS